MSHRSDDLDCNSSNNEHFQQVLDRGLASPSRRSLLRGGIGLGAVASLPMVAGCSDGAVPTLSAPSTPLSFSAVAKSVADQTTVPSGYTVRVLHATGDRLDSSIPAYSNTGAETDDWSRRIGDQHDGMDIFYIGTGGKYSPTATSSAVLAVNHESSAEAHFFHPKGQTSKGVSGKKFDQFGQWDLGQRPALESLKEINHHGVSIVELSLDSAGRPTGYKLDSPLNRHVTGQSLTRIAGPAAHINDIKQFMVTKFDPTGASARGTLNNCGHGKTPWGTYLGCEENWAVYWQIPTTGKAADAKITASRARYGVARAPLAATATTGTGQGWYTVADADPDMVFARWNISADGASAAADFRNEPNTFGYNVEIDPLAPQSIPAKRVAMGRFAHKACVCSVPVAGKPLAFYMGCDSRNEYIYKFVTAQNWSASDIGGGMAAGDKYLNEGKLYVAKFNSDGSGEWIELDINNPLIKGYSAYSFANQADVYVNTRHAADAVGATKWIAQSGEHSTPPMATFISH